MNYYELFNQFCLYVHEHIFSEENIGSYVSFVVDSSFINDFCSKVSCDERSLMTAVRTQLYNNRRDDMTVKGILAIQLYAASKRANSDGVTEKNYRDRLSQVLNWDINDLQYWMSDYQEIYWETLYRWCDSHFFQITKCQRKTGAGRYVQYPVNQALRVFTDEDLKYIAAYFVEKKLLPGEDIQQKDFWRIISRHRIPFYIGTNHGRNVIFHSISVDDYCDQVYHFYLRWNGEYKRFNKKGIFGDRDQDSYLYMRDNFSSLEFRDSHLRLLHAMNLNDFKYKDLCQHYTFKYDGMILFKQDDIYDDYLQECRYLDDGEEGYALCLKNKSSHLTYRSGFKTIFENKEIRIYRVVKNNITRDLFATPRFYELYGGLKVGRRTYLLGGAPILRFSQPTKFWIDGVFHNEYGNDLSVNLNDLKVGFHYIKIPNSKKIEIEICKPNLSTPIWLNENNKWVISQKEQKWDSEKCEDGIVGLDFSIIPQECKNKNDFSSLRRWSNFQTFGTLNRKEKNITIKLLSNIYHNGNETL